MHIAFQRVLTNIRLSKDVLESLNWIINRGFGIKCLSHQFKIFSEYFRAQFFSEKKWNEVRGWLHKGQRTGGPLEKASRSCVGSAFM